MANGRDLLLALNGGLGGVAPHDAVSPHDAVAPNHAEALVGAVPPNNGIAPDYAGAAYKDRVTPNQGRPPSQGVAPDHAGSQDYGSLAGGGAIHDGWRERD